VIKTRTFLYVQMHLYGSCAVIRGPGA